MSFISRMNREDLVTGASALALGCVASYYDWTWTGRFLGTVGAALLGSSYFQAKGQAQADLLPTLQTLERDLRQAQSNGTFEVNKAILTQRYLALQPHVLPNSSGHAILTRIYQLFSTPAAPLGNISELLMQLANDVTQASSTGTLGSTKDALTLRFNALYQHPDIGQVSADPFVIQVFQEIRGILTGAASTSLATTTAASAPIPLKLVSYNVLADCTVRATGDRQFGDRKTSEPQVFDRTQRTARIVSTLKNLDADVYCLQEVDAQAFQAIKTGLGNGYTGAYRPNGDGRYGQAMFVRTTTTSPLQNRLQVVSETSYVHTSTTRRAAQVATIALPALGKTIQIANLHLDFTHGAQNLRDLIPSLSQQNDGTIFVGDYNQDANSAVVRVLTDAGYTLDRSLSSTIGRPSSRSAHQNDYRMRPIDHVVHSAELQSQTSAVCSQQYLGANEMPNLEQGSDHSAVVSHITFKPTLAPIQTVARSAATVSAFELHKNALAAKAQQGFIPFYGERADHDPLTNFLGNFSNYPVAINFGGQIGPLAFTCSESAFQACKFVHDPVLLRQFCGTTPQNSLDLANSHTAKVNPQWVNRQNAEQGQNVQWMRHIVDQKFQQHPELKQLLLATANAYLVEHSPLRSNGSARDSFWANGYNGTGQNLLGKILMETRGRLGGTGVVAAPSEYTAWLQTGARTYHTQNHPMPQSQQAAVSRAVTASQPAAQTAPALRLPNVRTYVSMVQGDIVSQNGVQAIVNAANPQLRNGGGVAGAIFTAAGAAQMAQLCSAYPNGCQTGNAVVTDSGALITRGISKVIHGVAPVYDPNQHDASCQKLYQTYMSILGAAKEYEIKRLALPALGTLNYGFSMEIATAMQLKAVAAFLKGHPDAFDEIRFVYYSAQELAKAQTAMAYFR